MCCILFLYVYVCVTKRILYISSTHTHTHTFILSIGVDVISLRQTYFEANILAKIPYISKPRTWHARMGSIEISIQRFPTAATIRISLNNVPACVYVWDRRERLRRLAIRRPNRWCRLQHEQLYRRCVFWRASIYAFSENNVWSVSRSHYRLSRGQMCRKEWAAKPLQTFENEYQAIERSRKRRRGFRCSSQCFLKYISPLFI